MARLNPSLKRRETSLLDSRIPGRMGRESRFKRRQWLEIRRGVGDPFMVRSPNLILIEFCPRIVSGVPAGDFNRTAQGTAGLPTFRHRAITLEKRVELYEQSGML